MRLPAILTACMMGLAGGAATALPGAARDAPRLSPLQIMADVTLIDARCHGLVADFGTLFRFVEANGIETSSVLPLGKQRQKFEAASALRATTPTEELCTVVAEQDEEAAPGVINWSRKGSGPPP